MGRSVPPTTLYYTGLTLALATLTLYTLQGGALAPLQGNT